MEDDDQDRGDEEIGQDVETLEREEEIKAKRDNAHDDMWMRSFHKDTCYNTLSHASACAQMGVRENTRVRVFCSHLDGSNHFLEQAEEGRQLRPLDGALDLKVCLH